MEPFVTSEMADLMLRCDQLQQQRDELLEAAEAFIGSACRPGDDGKYDDSFDDKRRNLRGIISRIKSARAPGG